MTLFTVSNLIYIAVAVAAGLYARSKGWVGGGTAAPVIPDIVPGRPLINAALKEVIARLLDPATQSQAAALLHDAEVKLLNTYRPEIAKAVPNLLPFLDGLVSTPAAPKVPA